MEIEWIISMGIATVLSALAVGYLVAVERGWLPRIVKTERVYVTPEEPNLRMGDHVPPFVDICPFDSNRWQWRTPSGQWYKVQRRGISLWSIAVLNEAERILTKDGEQMVANWLTIATFDAKDWFPKTLEQVRQKASLHSETPKGTADEY